VILQRVKLTTTDASLRSGGSVEIRATSLLFPETSGEGPLTAEAEVVFPRDVERVTAGITGYTAVFEDEEDHHVGRLEVEVDARVDADDPTKVVVSGRFGLRDWSNEFDDPYAPSTSSSPTRRASGS
jgi:hypothetical protein